MTPTFKRILVAIDFGPESDAALRCCASLARGLGASLHLLHVVKDPILAVSNPELYGIDWVTLRSDMLTEGRHQLAARAGSLTGVPMTCEAVVGRAADAIVEKADEIGAQLIVMGTHGRSGVGHLLIGSVAERVVRTAPCPVMTVRGSGAVRVLARERTAAHVGS